VNAGSSAVTPPENIQFICDQIRLLPRHLLDVKMSDPNWILVMITPPWSDIVTRTYLDRVTQDRAL
jgi:hypothetical protein